MDDGTLTLPRAVGRSSDHHPALEETAGDTPAAQGAYRRNGNNGNRGSIASPLCESLEPTISPFCGSSNSSLHAAALTMHKSPAIPPCRVADTGAWNLSCPTCNILSPRQWLVICWMSTLLNPGARFFLVPLRTFSHQLFGKSHSFTLLIQGQQPGAPLTMLWCASHTADAGVLHIPGSRTKVTNSLYEIATTMAAERDPDGWHRVPG